MNRILDWIKRTLSNPQVAYLVLFLSAVAFVTLFLGAYLAPVIAAFILAYLMEGTVGKIVDWLKIRRIVAVWLVFFVFLMSFFGLLFMLLPLVSQEIAEVAREVPLWPEAVTREFKKLPTKYPEYTNQFALVMSTIEGDWLNETITKAPTTLADLVPKLSKQLLTTLVYVVIVPLLVLYFLKDKDKIKDWFTRFLPQDDHRLLAREVFKDVDKQIANYVRGKFLEIIIVWSVSYIVFRFLQMPYTMVLSLFVGLSVLLPYVGATVMTIPIVVVAIISKGFTMDAGWIIIAYGIVQLLDGNVLAPVLLSNVTNLHPIAIISAILLFGGIWGFWGVFFAIPLATLVNAVITAWPTARRRKESLEEETPQVLSRRRLWANLISGSMATGAILVMLLHSTSRPEQLRETILPPVSAVPIVPEDLGPLVLSVRHGVILSLDGAPLDAADLERRLSRLHASDRPLKLRIGPSVPDVSLLDVFATVSKAGFEEYDIERKSASDLESSESEN